MSPQAFRELVRRPTWSKEVVVWVGPTDKLDGLLEGMSQVKLDLLDLFPDDETLPVSKEERAQQVQQRLVEFLKKNKPTTGRSLLRVENAALFASCGLGLQAFYDWFGGSRTFTVLEIDRLRSVSIPSHLEGILRIDPAWLPEYFKTLLTTPDRICMETS
jgi:hypothetical protein